MNRLFYLPIIAAAAAAMTRDARACEPLGYVTHTVDPSMQATDQMPPTLPAMGITLLALIATACGRRRR